MSLKAQKQRILSLQRLFYRGNYREILAAVHDQPSSVKRARDAWVVLASLSFLSRMEEAELLFQNWQKDWTQSQKMAAGFFLAVNWTRLSHYEQARQHLARNAKAWRSLRSSSSVLEKQAAFFHWQGLAFYRFFSGQFVRALQLSQRSYIEAFQNKFLFGKILATDLRAHCLVKCGQLSEGLRHFEQALLMAESLGAGGTTVALQTSMLNTCMRHGLPLSQRLKKFQKKIDKNQFQDGYSRSAYLLELSHNLLWQGKPQRALSALDEACRLIYAYRNRRQEITLNLRYAAIFLSQGEIMQALNLIRSASHLIDPKVDRIYLLELSLLEKKVLAQLGLPLPHDHDEKILKLLHLTGDYLSQRSWQRDHPESKAVYWRKGEDWMGDLLDQLPKGGIDVILAVLSSGYIGLLRRLLFTSQKKVLDAQVLHFYFGVQPGLLLVFRRGAVYSLTGFNEQHKKLLLLLQEGEQSKESLVKRLWGYRYDPIRHDGLIYSTLSKIRRLMGDALPDFIRSNERGYSIAEPFVLSHFREPDLDPVVQRDLSSKSKPALARVTEATLNYRQYEILRLLKERRTLDVRSCKSLFKVSVITAHRDLAQLYQLGYLLRTGNARATRYSRRDLLDEAI